MVLLIDNYDSFVHNLARHFVRLGQNTIVVRNDQTTFDDVRRLKPQAVVISPGPCTPAEAGCSVDVVAQLHAELPILGVCLGHQAIAVALGGRVVRAAEPRHGRTSLIRHEARRLFAGLPTLLEVCRYHSLAIDEASLPASLRATAWADDGTIMAIEHESAPLFGVQFHPEAALTCGGYRLLANFLALAGCPVEVDVAKLAASENHSPPAPSYVPPSQPITF